MTHAQGFERFARTCLGRPPRLNDGSLEDPTQIP